MAIRHVNVSIRRDELTTLRISVAEWEVPLLHLVHGEGAVQELEGEPWADVDAPNVQDEYRRLQNKYKAPVNDDGSPGQQPVVSVYGSFGASPLLRQAIENATFDRPADLLGLNKDQLTAAADEAEAKAKAARAAADAAGGGSTTPAVKKASSKKAAASSLL
jgi:hypothetical protein